MKNKLIRHLMFTLIFIIGGINNYCIGQVQLDQLMSNSVIPFDSMGQITNEFERRLNESLKNVRIVALGESLHEDGLTFEHKAMLVKYLHKKLGFNVIAFEFGFYGNWKANENLKKGKEVKESTKYSGWSKSKYAFPVYDYISQTHKTDNPLHYAGFDGEKVPDGIPNIKEYLDNIIELVDYPINNNEKMLLDSLVHAVYGKIGNEYKDELKYKRRELATVIIKDLYKRIITKKDIFIEQFGERNYMMYKLTLKSILMDQKSTYAGAFWNIVRDKHMAERVKWLADSLYKDQKIILWGASAHFARNMVTIDRKLDSDDYGYYPYFQMGDWLYAHYGKSFYSIAFTSASGKTGLILPEDHKYKKYEEIKDIPKPHNNSFENIAYLTGNPILYCDLRAADENTWLKAKFISYPFGYIQDTAIWNKIIDGIYFIREMKPDEWKDN